MTNDTIRLLMNLIFGMFLLMQNNHVALPKQAVDAALRGDWKKAIEVNLLILEKFPNDLDTKARLGKAYLQTKNFTKAKKLFKEILDKDPINTIAKKNYELARDKIAITVKTETNHKALIKEPGISTEMFVELKKPLKNPLLVGEKLKIKPGKRAIKVFRDNTLLGECTDSSIIASLKKAKDEKAETQAFYASNKDLKLKIILKCTKPVFKAEKQTLKPYLKKGTLKEPELEISELEEEEE